MFISIRYLTIIAINKTIYLDLTYFKRHYSDRRYDKSITTTNKLQKLILGKIFVNSFTKSIDKLFLCNNDILFFLALTIMIIYLY